MIYISAIILTILCSLVVCSLSNKLGFVDSPDGIRKVHKGNIALGGGICLFSPLILCFYLFPDFSLSINDDVKIIVLCSLIILFLGLLDDIKSLPISIRLIGQIITSWIIIIITDLYVKDLGDLLGIGSIYLGELGIPITIFMVVGVTNAFNMLDGMDGLVSLVALVCFGGLSVITYLSGIASPEFALISSVLFIFLLFNLGLFKRRWKIFLGDSGALWLGFLIAWTLVYLASDENKLIEPVSAIWIILLPLIDALSTFIGRLRQGKPIFYGDRAHIHHALLDSGLKKWKVLVIILIISLISCSVIVFTTLYEVKEFYLFYGFLTIWLFYYLLLKYPLSKDL
tara:strand:- start:2998 stop:4023 length:1026 start_codon:yes stop_codon:yes gene_type:complete